MIVLCFSSFIFTDIFEYAYFDDFVTYDLSDYIINNFSDDIFESLCRDNWSYSLNYEIL